MAHCLLDNDRITLFVIHIKVRDNLSKECHNQFGARPDTIEITEKIAIGGEDRCSQLYA